MAVVKALPMYSGLQFECHSCYLMLNLKGINSCISYNTSGVGALRARGHCIIANGLKGFVLHLQKASHSIHPSVWAVSGAVLTIQPSS